MALFRVPSTTFGWIAIAIAVLFHMAHPSESLRSWRLIQSTFNMSDTQIHNVIWIYVYVLYIDWSEMVNTIHSVRCACISNGAKRDSFLLFSLDVLFFLFLFRSAVPLSTGTMILFTVCFSLTVSFSQFVCVVYVCMKDTISFISETFVYACAVLFRRIERERTPCSIRFAVMWNFQPVIYH